ncbi:CaiB/BaiF CoA transferase family protein [uncultured Jatrophihabitans sp.]|uniref:CaiB/BaiF CoA transferase family protein n=1 Tax=uncultured Jatrophihabitans sp. TaxID=1610747 RepID=UPI0035CBAACF
MGTRLTDSPLRGTDGPLRGIRVLDVSSLGPGPFCSMLLADHGADVVCVERPQRESFDPSMYFSRGKRSIVVDLRAPGGSDVIRRLAGEADVFLEGYRPGAMERRGLGPDILLGDNPRLVYTRLTGYGQTGPYAHRAGHDINYIATAGVLSAVGTDTPVPPLNMLGDFASGSFNALLGIVLALLDRERTGRGQVIDAAMVDGAALLLTAQLAEFSMGRWAGRGTSVLSGAAPYYGAYQCSDGAWFAVGAIEQRFYVQMVAALGLDPAALPDRDDERTWPRLREIFAAAFAVEPRLHWEKKFADVDGCGSAVLELDELADDPHLSARGTVLATDDDGLQAGVAPRLSNSTGELGAVVDVAGRDTEQVLAENGFSAAEIADLTARAVVRAG